ncbi:hypothetical protein [Dyadobacter alkalitolerans]|uniref:hypothetical protein n=1 Tax=Dyadobacter alkalitolerans TaxID=492736 RepID=UPI0004185327|nr:hypothetical protein [Dyadobacter alkalitolerans]
MENTVISPNQYTEEELIKHFPGFTHHHANVNGVELHYVDGSKMGTLDRAVYASAYNEAASIRASNAWYQTFTQDIEDAKHYHPLEMPVLGIGSNVSYNYMKMGLPYVATNVKVEGILDSGHYMFEEQPKKVIELVSGFLAF